MKTHWKKLTNPDYLGSYALQPNEIRPLKITHVTREMVRGQNNKKEECTIVHFENSKPMICNVTNAKMISRHAGSSYVEDWAGTLIQVWTKVVSVAGEEVEAIRVHPQKPTSTHSQLPVEKSFLTPDKKAWEPTKEKLSLGEITIEQVKDKFKLTEEHERQILGYE
jgi:hypothetical protein